MLRNQHGGAGALQARDRIAQAQHGVHVKGGRRLVEHVGHRAHRACRGRGHQLLLPSRKRPDVAVQQPLDGKHAGGAVHARADLVAGKPAFSQPNAISDVVSKLKNCVRGFWKTLPTTRASPSNSHSSMGTPATRTDPSATPAYIAGTRPFTMRASVVFPQPEGPVTTTTSPACTTRSMPPTAPASADA